MLRYDRVLTPDGRTLVMDMLGAFEMEFSGDSLPIFRWSDDATGVIHARRLILTRHASAPCFAGGFWAPPEPKLGEEQIGNLQEYYIPADPREVLDLFRVPEGQTSEIPVILLPILQKAKSHQVSRRDERQPDRVPTGYIAIKAAWLTQAFDYGNATRGELVKRAISAGDIDGQIVIGGQLYVHPVDETRRQQLIDVQEEKRNCRKRK